MTTLIDCYGHIASSKRYQRRDYKKQPYLIASDGEVTYICFSRAAKRPIHRIVENGGDTEILWAFGAWEDRANLTYTATLNDALAVDDTDVEG